MISKRQNYAEVTARHKHKPNFTRPSCHSHPVQIGVRIFWHVVVEDDVHSLDVHPSAKQVRGHQDPPLEVFELLIARQPGEFEQSQTEDYDHSCWVLWTVSWCVELTDEASGSINMLSIHRETGRCVCVHVCELHLSSWAIPLWMAMAGKFCSTSSWDRAMQRCTDLTKITT